MGAPCSEFAKVEGPAVGTLETAPTSPIPTPVQVQEPRPLLERASSGDSPDLWEGCVKGGRPRASPVTQCLTDGASDVVSHPGLSDSCEASRDVFKSASSCPDLLAGRPAAGAGAPPEGAARLPPGYPGSSRRSADDLLRDPLPRLSSLDDPLTEKRVHGSPSALYYLRTGLSPR